MAITLTDLKDLAGKDNIGGIKTKLYFAPESAFSPDGLMEVGVDGVTIAGPHTFPVGEGFRQIYATLDGGEFKLETTGERDGRGKSVAGEFFHPGNTPEAAAFDRVCKNTPGILLVEEMDGTITQYGAKGLPVEISGAYTSAKQSGGRRGWTFTVSGYQNGMQHYTGAIPLKTV